MTRHQDVSQSAAGPLQVRPAPRGIHLVVAAIRSAATYVAVSLYVLLVGPAGVAIAWLFGCPGLLFALAHRGVAVGLALAGLKARVAGRDRLPAGRAAVYCANHTSNVDPPLLFHVLHPRLRMLFKAEFDRVPILGRAARVAGFVPVERRHPEHARESVERAAESVARGCSFLVFPEGTRSRTGELLPFKKGGFIMAIKAQVPIVPVAVLGGRTAMSKGSPLIRAATIDVRVGEPIETTGMTVADRDRLAGAARARIQAMLEGRE